MNRFFLAGGIGAMALSLALPSPLAGFQSDAVIGGLTGGSASEQRVLPGSSSRPQAEQRASRVQQESPTVEERTDFSHWILSPLMRSTAAASQHEDGLVPALTVPVMNPPKDVDIAAEPTESPLPEKVGGEDRLSPKDEPQAATEQALTEAEPQLALLGSASSSSPSSDTGAADNQAEAFSSLRSLLVSPGQPASAEPSPPAIEEQPPEKDIEAPPVPEPIIGVAERVVVPSIGIDIGVRPGAYDVATGSWEVDDTSAFHADTTVPVNDTNGTSLIYGHAKWGIFGSLPDAVPGTEATVYAADGLRFVYVLESVRQVSPDDVSLLTADGPPKLMLQTCSGWFDEHRTLAIFGLKEVIQE